MSGGMPDGRNEAFQQRLQRINEARHEAEVSALLDEDGNEFPDRTEISPLPDWRATVRGPATLIAAAVVGLLMVCVVRLIRFHFMGTSLAGGDAPSLSMVMDIGLACGLGVLLFICLRQTETPLKFAVIGGVLVMTTFMHNFVHASPQVFSLIFSQEWTEDVIAETQPASILFRGQSFLLIPEKEEEKKMPTVRRL